MKKIRCLQVIPHPPHSRQLHEPTKLVRARALVPCRINRITNDNFAIVRRCCTVEDRPQRPRVPEQVEENFHIYKKSANNHSKVGFKQTQVPQCLYVAPDYLVELIWHYVCLTVHYLVRKVMVLNQGLYFRGVAYQRVGVYL